MPCFASFSGSVWHIVQNISYSSLWHILSNGCSWRCKTEATCRCKNTKYFNCVINWKKMYITWVSMRPSRDDRTTCMSLIWLIFQNLFFIVLRRRKLCRCQYFSIVIVLFVLAVTHLWVICHHFCCPTCMLLSQGHVAFWNYTLIEPDR